MTYKITLKNKKSNTSCQLFQEIKSVENGLKSKKS